MPLIISDTNNYTRSFNKSIFNKILIKSLKYLKISSKIIFITFISDYRMKKLNYMFKKNNKSTDVLSFNYDNKMNEVLGEIFISTNYCKKNIKTNNNSLKKEIILIAIHGILHLIGYNHTKKEDEKKMFMLQNKLYEKFIKE
tara:strand:+ start:1192 stop:1617 length:426 start_codon:yes stop_codon:yes gene_type:complete